MKNLRDYFKLALHYDVPEKSASKAIEATRDVVEISDQVPCEILKREWQKVWFRNEYRNS